MKPVNWFIIGFILTVMEIVHPAFVIFWFGIAGVVTGIIALFLHSLGPQVAIFAVLSGILVLASRPLARRWTHGSPDKVGSERLSGAQGLVLSAIQPPAMGMVKVLGDTMRAEADAPIEAGRMIRVKEVVGTHVVVEPLPKEERVKSEG